MYTLSVILSPVVAVSQIFPILAAFIDKMKVQNLAPIRFLTDGAPNARAFCNARPDVTVQITTTQENAETFGDAGRRRNAALMADGAEILFVGAIGTMSALHFARALMTNAGHTTGAALYQMLGDEAPRRIRKAADFAVSIPAQGTRAAITTLWPDGAPVHRGEREAHIWGRITK